MTKRLPTDIEIKNALDLRKLGSTAQSGGSPLYNPTGAASGGGGGDNHIYIREDVETAIAIGADAHKCVGQLLATPDWTFSITLTKAAGNNRLVIGTMRNAHGSPFASMTLDGVAGTELVVNTTLDYAIVYWLDADLPATAGAYTIACDCTGAGDNFTVSAAVELYNVDQVDPFGTLVEDDELDLTVACATGDLVIDWIFKANSSTSMTPDAGQTLILEDPSTYGFGCYEAMSYKVAASNSEAMGWDAGASVKHWAIPVKAPVSVGAILRVLVVPEDTIVSDDGNGTVEIEFPATSLADHDHSGDSGDGGTFDAANLTSGEATDGYVLTADGAGGAAWEAASATGGGTDGGTDVAARYSTNAGQSIVNNTNPAIIDFGDKSFDTHTAVTTGATWKFTAPTNQGGYYQVNATATLTASNGWAAGERGILWLYKNGVAYSILDYKNNLSGTNVLMNLSGSDIVDLAAGDYIDIRIAQNSGGNIALDATTAFNYVSIVKVKG